MSLGRISYRTSFLAGWYLYWRSALVGLAVGFPSAVALIALSGFLAANVPGSLHSEITGFFSVHTESRGMTGTSFGLFVLLFTIYQLAKNTWVEVSKGGIEYLDIVGAVLCCALLISSTLQYVVPGAAGDGPYMRVAYASACFFLAMLGGLDFFVRSFITKQFARFKVLAVRETAEGQATVTELLPTERIRVAWFLLWRGLGIGILVDIAFTAVIAVLLFPFWDTAFVHRAALVLGRAAASSGLLFSIMLVGFPLTIPQLVQRNFPTQGATLRFQLVSAASRRKPTRSVKIA